MSHTVVLLVAADEAVEWLEFVLEDMVLCGLADPPVIVRLAADHADDPMAAFLDPADEAPPLPLDQLLASRRAIDDVRFVRVVLAGSPGPPVARFSSRYRIVSPKARWVNVMVPTEPADGDGTPAMSAAEVLPAWANVVVSPEDRSVVAPAPVTGDGGYIAHAAAALATIAGLWASQAGATTVDLLTPSTNDQVIAVARTSSRSLIIDHAADRAVARALQRRIGGERLVFRGEQALSMAKDSTVRRWSDIAARTWIDLTPNHPFRFRDPRPLPPPPTQQLGLMETIQILRDYLTRRVPYEIAEDVQTRIDDTRDRLEHDLSGYVFGTNSRFRVTLGGPRVEVPGAEPAEIEGSRPALEEQLAEFVEAADGILGVHPEIATWRQLKDISLGMLDADELPDVVQQALPSPRSPAPDPALLFGPPIGPDVILKDVRTLLPPCDHLLHDGDVVGLDDVREIVRREITGLGGTVSDSTDAKTASASTSRRPWFLLPSVAAVGGIVAIVQRQTELTTPWWAAIAGLGLVAIVCFVFGVRPSKGPGAATPSAAAAGPPAQTTSQLWNTAASMSPEERQAAIKLLKLQLVQLDELAALLSPSFIGLVARRLADELQTAIDRSSSLRQMIPARPTNPTEPVEATPKKRRNKVRWRTRVARLVLRVVVGFVLAVGVVVVTGLLPLAVPVVIAAGVVAFLTWIWSSLKFASSWIRARWQEAFRLPAGESPEAFASRAVYYSLTEVARLNRLYGILLEWCVLLRPVADDPFGPPAMLPDRQVSIGLRQLHAHQVASGEVDGSSRRRMTSGLEQQFFQTGWLVRAFDFHVDAAMKEFAWTNNLHDAAVLNPFADVSVGPVPQDRSARPALRNWLLDPAQRFALRSQRIADGFASLATKPAGELVRGIRNGDTTVAMDDPGGAFLREPLEVAAGPLLASPWSTGNAPEVTARSAWVSAGVGAQLEALARSGAITDLVFCHPGALGVAEGVSEIQVMRGPSSGRLLLLQVVGLELSLHQAVSGLRVLGSGPIRRIEPDHLVPMSPVLQDPIRRVTPQTLAARRAEKVLPIDSFPVGSIIAEPAAPPSVQSDSFEFLRVVDGEPLRFPSDLAIPFVVRQDGGPADALELVREALRRISRYSGLQFRFDGLTAEFPGYATERGISDPLWIGWVYPDESDDERLHGSEVLGLGAPRWFVPFTGRSVLAGGLATVRAELDYRTGFGPSSIGEVLLHELGHAMNLAHVDDVRQIMFPTTTTTAPSDYGDGDRCGLWALGAGRP